MDEDRFDLEGGDCGRNARMAIERRAAILESRPFFGSAPEAPQPIPEDLLRILACSEQPTEAITKLFSVATESLTPDDYKEKQHLLLFIEDFERSSWRGIVLHRWKPNSQRKTQDSDDVEPEKQPAVFVVKRPSGQEVPRKSTIARSNQPCRCFCQSVCLNGKIVATTEVEIVITLDADMEHTEVHEDVVLYFLKRSPLFRNLHQAVDKFPARLGTAGFPDLKSSSIFPQVYASFIDQPEVSLGAEKELWREAAVLLNREASGGKLTEEDRAALPKPRIPFYNCTLNYCQRCAVEAVVLGAHRPGPYIICGPPDGQEGVDFSGSKFNLGEGDVVKNYVRKLFSLGLPLTDIAVNSAYQAQISPIENRTT
ncbi:hypothetical protein RvY_05042 [Ramazzottius varieornatus]|uniref:Uncharacterized protein n=1 Tax=Ramazzottius varieornatus TaxID=947166 RepID=A0A1D1UWS9_RAMVA|nr:hypothetical protein RvY_05042 [Ramazzottius varieornatus]